MNLNEIKNHYKILRLKTTDCIASFDCGDDDLNDFILNEAPLYRKAMLAVSYAMTNNGTGETIAFFSLANDRISLSDFEERTDFNRFRRKRFVNEKRLKSYPAVKICRLGVVTGMQDKQIGRFLLYFIKTYFAEDNKTGCRFLTVDAYADAVPFYERNGFIPLNEDDKDERTRLMYFDLNDIAP